VYVLIPERGVSSTEVEAGDGVRLSGDAVGRPGGGGRLLAVALEAEAVGDDVEDD